MLFRSALKDKMEFYVAQDAVPAEDEDTDNIIIKEQRPALQEIKFCDPCCGSGHILTYAFDLLYDIYSEEGYDPTEIPRLIIEKNLYGIEIDERAAELAAFALSMKAREKDRLWFSRGIKPQICRLEKISFSEEEIEAYMQECGRDIFTLNFERMLTQFEDADTYGSLIVPAEQDLGGISEILYAKDFGGNVFFAPTHNKVLNLLSQADYLSSKYQVVVTNPPYLGTSGFGKDKKTWFRAKYPNSRADFFAMFMERCLSLNQANGFVAMINMQSWMFLSSYEKLRKHLVKHYDIVNMAHLGPRAFDSIGGEVVSTTSFVLQNKAPTNLKGAYFRLIEGRSEAEKMDMYLEAISNPDCGWFYRCQTSDFTMIPGSPIAYWVKIDANVWEKTLDVFFSSGGRMKTHGNEIYLRFVWEVSAKSDRWVLYCNGGDFRKYSGNVSTYIDWSLQAQQHYIEKGGMYNQKFGGMIGITWSLITSAKSSFRIKPSNSLYSSGSPTIFTLNASQILQIGRASCRERV